MNFGRIVRTDIAADENGVTATMRPEKGGDAS